MRIRADVPVGGVACDFGGCSTMSPLASPPPSAPSCRDRFGSEQPRKGRLARADRPAVDGWRRRARIVRATGTPKTCVRRWPQPFMEPGTSGLLIYKTRPSRIPPQAAAVRGPVVALTPSEPLGELTHWTAAAVANTCAISVSSLHRMWRSYGL